MKYIYKTQYDTFSLKNDNNLGFGFNIEVLELISELSISTFEHQGQG